MAISLDRTTLEAAATGYRQQLQQIAVKMAEIRRMLSGSKAKASAQPRSRRAARQKRQMSPEGRARIAEAQRARWAKVKKAE